MFEWLVGMGMEESGSGRLQRGDETVPGDARQVEERHTRGGSRSKHAPFGVPVEVTGMPRQGSGVDAKRRCGELRWKSSRKGQEGMGRIECRLRMGDERLLRTRDEHEKGTGKTAPGEEF